MKKIFKNQSYEPTPSATIVINSAIGFDWDDNYEYCIFFDTEKNDLGINVLGHGYIGNLTNDNTIKRCNISDEENTRYINQIVDFLRLKELFNADSIMKGNYPLFLACDVSIKEFSGDTYIIQRGEKRTQIFHKNDNLGISKYQNKKIVGELKYVANSKIKNINTSLLDECVNSFFEKYVYGENSAKKVLYNFLEIDTNYSGVTFTLNTTLWREFVYKFFEEKNIYKNYDSLFWDLDVLKKLEKKQKIYDANFEVERESIVRWATRKVGNNEKEITKLVNKVRYNKFYAYKGYTYDWDFYKKVFQ